jgi:transcriptional regulator
LYLPAHFNETRPEVMHALMRTYPLSTLVTQCDSGLVANHLPVQTIAEPKPLGSIRGHIARANPLWREYRAESQALAIFQGPQVYISPSFYPSKAKTGEVVPTWNYVVVHASGTLRFIHDAGWLRDFVSGLTATHEAPRSAAWKIDDAPASYIEKMLSLIVGFEFSIVTLAGKWKVSQNRPQVDQQGVLLNLQNAADPNSREMAAMLAALGPRALSPTDR